MPLVEDIRCGDCGLMTRFRFKRTKGPVKGYKSIGTYYLQLASPPNVTPAPNGIDMGFGGYVDPTPPRNFGLSWQPLARSVPAPLILGTTSIYTIVLRAMFYIGRSLHDVENFLRAAPNNIGPYPGDLEVYDSTGLCKFQKFPNAYFREMRFSYDGSRNFVEYDLVFETNEEPVIFASCFTAGTNNYIAACGPGGVPNGGIEVSEMPKLSLQNKEMIVGSPIPEANDQNTGMILAQTPLQNSHLWATINGVAYPIGDADTGQAFYFANPGPGSPKAFATLLAGDTLYFQGVNVGFGLGADDRISLHYLIP